jgi:hypothetical protein
MQLALPLQSEYSCFMLDFSAQYEALQRRDSALDGVFFVAVKTTRIYCRPVCKARTPFARNVSSILAPQPRSVLAIAPASAAALKRLRFVQRGRALRQL